MSSVESEVKPGRACPPHPPGMLRRATRRALIARLRAEVDALRIRLAFAESWNKLLEDEIDALRILAGHREVPA